MVPRNLKGVAADLLISLGIRAFSLGAVSSVTRRALFFSDNFADHVAASLQDPRVASFLAERTTDAILEQKPDASLFSEMGREVIVSVPDVGVLMRSALSNASPERRPSSEGVIS